MQNTGIVIGRLRETIEERREYLMRCFLNGLTEPLYHQTIGEIRGLDLTISYIDEITKSD
jgi:hypothetical protein